MSFYGYFDESGEHDPKFGKLTRLTIGGALASYEIWQEIGQEWDAILGDDLVFHMADFEASKGAFRELKEKKEEHKALMGALLGAITSKPYTLVGANFPVTRQRNPVTPTYEKCFADVVNGALTVNSLGKTNENLALMFAFHEEFSDAMIGNYCTVIRKCVASLTTCTTGKPECLRQLQVADLISYEISRMGRSDRSTLRYPITELLKAASGQHIFRA